MLKRKYVKRKPLFDAATFLTKVSSAYSHDLGTYACKSHYHSYAAHYWVKKLPKKFILDGEKSVLEERAFALFRETNEAMARYSDFSLPAGKDVNSNILQMTKNFIWEVLGDPPSQEEIFEWTRLSTGSSIGVPFWDTGAERKFSYPISATHEAARLWRNYKHYDPEFGHAVFKLNELVGISRGELSIVDGSRACTVPKTNDIDRMIAVEPVLNMFFQQGLLSLMDDRLSQFGLSMTDDPEKHRALAYEGSITNSLATIDFSSMSDRVSLGVAKSLLPRGWFVALESLRSEVMSIKGQNLKLEMISTMGNATTFPLETLVLWALATCCVQYRRERDSRNRASYLCIPDMRKRYWESVSVFGDDCILPSDCTSLFLNCSVQLGFQPNLDKSFFRDEYFRESCGGDFYHGRDVRPFFLGALPQTNRKVTLEAYLYKTINRVIQSYIKYFGTLTYVYDKQLLRYLFDCLKLVTDQVKFVPENFPEDSGITALRDITRIVRAYRLKPSQVSVNQHGQLTFSFLRFKFKDESPKNLHLRYSIELKKLWWRNQQYVVPNSIPYGRNVDGELWLRKRGTYVHQKSKQQVSVSLPKTF